MRHKESRRILGVLTAILLLILAYFLLWILRRTAGSTSLLFEQITLVACSIPIIEKIILRRWCSKRYHAFGTFLKQSGVALLSSLVFWSSAQFLLLNIDRSRSFYVISWIAQGKIDVFDHSISLDRVKSNEKLNYRAIEDRIGENSTRGLLHLKNGELKLTNLGEVVLRISNFLAPQFKLSGWFQNRN